MEHQEPTSSNQQFDSRKRKTDDYENRSIKKLKSTNNDELTQDIDKIVNVLKLSSDYIDVFERLQRNYDQKNRVEIVINDLLGSQQAENATASIYTSPSPESTHHDKLFDDVSKVLEILNRLQPDAVLDEEKAFNILERVSCDPNRIEFTVETLLKDSSQPNPLDSTASPEIAEVIEINSSNDTEDKDDKDDKDDMDDDDINESSIIDLDTDVDLRKALQLSDDIAALLPVFPDVDISWLDERLLEHYDNPVRVQLVSDMMSEKFYPKVHRTTTGMREELETMNFEFDEFLKMHPDPEKYYYGSPEDGPRQDKPPSYVQHALYYLMKEFIHVAAKDIESALKKKSKAYAPARRYLTRMMSNREARKNYKKRTHTRPEIYRSLSEPPDELFYKELWFVRNEGKLLDFLLEKKKDRQAKLTRARLDGSLMTCQICCDDEVLFEEMLPCREGHIFCPRCVRMSVEIAIGEGKTRFQCLTSINCTSDFTTGVLMRILPEKILGKALDRKLGDDLMESNNGLSDMVQCPFCPYMESMPDHCNKLLKCQNPECLKESCRICKETSHIPLRCEEVEKKGEVDFRTTIENEMTEAMVRTCWRCKKRFFKVEGCNKMTCPCGATMCYLCKKPVKDYSHFNDEPGGCPLHSDTNVLHTDEVLKAAQVAKVKYVHQHPEAAEIGLKHDPLKNMGKGTKIKKKKTAR